MRMGRSTPTLLNADDGNYLACSRPSVASCVERVSNNCAHPHGRSLLPHAGVRVRTCPDTQPPAGLRAPNIHPTSDDTLDTPSGSHADPG